MTTQNWNNIIWQEKWKIGVAWLMSLWKRGKRGFVERFFVFINSDLLEENWKIEDNHVEGLMIQLGTGQAINSWKMRKSSRGMNIFNYDTRM